jgi:hypothetical protein
MKLRPGTTAQMQQGGRAASDADDARHWVEAWANHVQKRFDSRALVSARIADAASVALSHVYALEGGGIVLVTPCDHAADDAPHEHAADEHGADEHTAPVHPAHDRHMHPHGPGERCGGDCELWLASPAQVVFEVRCAAEGALCTGFGFLGLSRTPHVLVARAREAPPKRGHDHGEF